MPNIVVAIPNTGQSVMRPIVIDMVDQLKEITGIGKDIEVFYPDNQAGASQRGSTIDSDSERFARLSTTRRIQVEVEEDYETQDVLNTAIKRHEHNPVWMDRYLGVYVTPVYSPTNISIHLKYITHSKEDAMMWRNTMRLKMSSYGETNVHEISYHYNLPPAVINLLTQVHINREDQYGYGDNLESYIMSQASPRLRIVGRSDGKTHNLSIAERQGRIIGYYDFEGVPEKLANEDSGMWSIGFTYRFTYDKPLAVNLVYPILVHNALLPEQYVSFTKDHFDPSKQTREYRRSLSDMRYFETGKVMNELRPNGYTPVIPDFDDMYLDQVIPYSATILRAATTVEEDRVSFFNLNDLDDYYIAPSVLRFIKEVEYPYITQPFKSVFNFSLYRNDKLTPGGTLELNENLDVYASRPINPREQHRVRFSIMTNWDLVDKDAIDRILQYPDVIVDIIDSIGDIIRSDPDNQGNNNTDYGQGNNDNNWANLLDCIERRMRINGRSKYRALLYCLGIIKDGNGNQWTEDWPSNDILGPGNKDENGLYPWEKPDWRPPTINVRDPDMIRHNTVTRVGIIALNTRRT